MVTIADDTIHTETETETETEEEEHEHHISHQHEHEEEQEQETRRTKRKRGRRMGAMDGVMGRWGDGNYINNQQMQRGRPLQSTSARREAPWCSSATTHDRHRRIAGVSLSPSNMSFSAAPKPLKTDGRQCDSSLSQQHM